MQELAQQSKVSYAEKNLKSQQTDHPIRFCQAPSRCWTPIPSTSWLMETRIHLQQHKGKPPSSKKNEISQTMWQGKWPTLVAKFTNMILAPPSGQIYNLCKWSPLVTKYETNESGTKFATTILTIYKSSLNQWLGPGFVERHSRTDPPKFEQFAPAHRSTQVAAYSMLLAVIRMIILIEQ